MAKYDKDIFIINDRPILKKKRKILDDLNDVDNVTLPSSILSRIEPKKDNKKEDEKDDTVDDDWLNAVSSLKEPSPKKKMKKEFGGFLSNKEKKKKDKKNKKGESLTDFNKEFDPELNALKNLYTDQSKFTNSLQAKYNEMDGKKASVRGIGKFTIDLVDSISSSRSITLSILDKIVSTKKIINELSMKEKEKLAKKSNDATDNNAAYASTFMAKALQMGRQSINNANFGYDANTYVDTDTVSAGDILDEIEGEERDPSVDAYLRYENKGIKILVVADEDGNWNYQAQDPDGNIVDDYPLPMRGYMDLHPDMHKAIDEFGTPYDLIME